MSDTSVSYNTFLGVFVPPPRRMSSLIPRPQQCGNERENQNVPSDSSKTSRKRKSKRNAIDQEKSFKKIQYQYISDLMDQDIVFKRLTSERMRIDAEFVVCLASLGKSFKEIEDIMFNSRKDFK